MKEANLLDITDISCGARIQDAGITRMSPAEWAAIPDNPRQRDTEARAKRAVHLLVAHPCHRKVNGAILPDGTRIKVDGHTRGWLWARGLAQAPDIVDVQWWRCAARQDAMNLYSTFDSPAAVERASDRMYGGMRALNLQFESELLKSRRFTTAIDVAYSSLFSARVDVFEHLRYWEPELKLFDRCGPTSKRFITGLSAGALLTFRRYGAEASPFWDAFSKNAGMKVDREMDAVQALTERAAAIVRTRNTVGRGNHENLIAVVISAFERYRRGESYSTENLAGIKAARGESLKRWLAAAVCTDRVW